MRRFSSFGLLYALLVPLWMIAVADMLWWRVLDFRLSLWLVTLIQYTVFSATAAAGLLLTISKWRRGTRAFCAAATAAYLPVWQWSMYASEKLKVPLLYDVCHDTGLGLLFLIGLMWVVWYLELCARHFRARERTQDLKPEKPVSAVWNPLNQQAWYYFRSRKLNQSAAAFATYSLAFALALFLFSRIQGCQERYDLPGGGGGGGGAKASQGAKKVEVQIKKVVRKKYLINPYSLVKFSPPPIDEVKLNLAQATEHLYKVGYGGGTGTGIGEGDGEGSGFGGPGGKVRFIRLEYPGGDWDQDFGVGADLNMLIQFGVLTSMKVAEQTESRSIFALDRFPLGGSPPLMYLTGQRNISLSVGEIKILREYLLIKHGMIFGDNGGSAHFHSQFFAAMRQILPEVEPVRVPLDDIIHRGPFVLPFLPYVAPHGGRDAWGWKVDGRWVVYYHPGDIGDAWADGHSNVPREVYEACYQLGANVIYYAHAEYKKWRDAQKFK